MEDMRLFLIALKVGQYSIHGRRVLKETAPYYFCQGYTISPDGIEICVDNEKCVGERVFNDYLRERAEHGNDVPQVSIHAIVGKNGSGKSSIVEMMMRLLNNFAAILFGEAITDGYTEHLHFIDGIEGELFYWQGGNPYRLSICGRKMNLDRYVLDVQATNHEFEVYKIVKDKNLPEISENSLDPILEDFDLGTGDVIKHFIDAIFYSIVSNYSIYAYNTLDFSDENVSEKYEKQILKKKFDNEANKIKITSSMRNWLHGLFHKNDGYKTPLVLTPFRKDGVIDINVENTLSRERFISLLLMSNDSEGKGFRIINGHLEVKGFGVKRKVDYGRAYINKNVDVTELTEKKYQELRIFIFSKWNEKLFGFDSSQDLEKFAETKKYGQEALNYLLYKTIKICTKYHSYDYFVDELEKYLNNEDAVNGFFDVLDEYFDNLIENRSHITRKIRQTLAYLIMPQSNDVYGKKRGEISLSEMAKSAQDTVKYIKNEYDYEFYLKDIEDVLPPPFLDVRVLLKNTEGESKTKIAFETLSSGEKQQIYSISSILYHLMNINSVEEDKLSNRYCYHYVNIVLEEIELYFHPDFQKRYISMILDGIAQIKLESIYGINICFITHSPFVLSDIPKNNLLVLENGRSAEDKKLKTFGANIYDMLKSSFFIEDTPIGSYAQWVITRVIIAMRTWRCIQEHPELKGGDLIKMVSSPKIKEHSVAFLKRYIDEKKQNVWDSYAFKKRYSQETLYCMIKQIDEPLVRNSLLIEWEELFTSNSKNEREIARLKRRIEELSES